MSERDKASVCVSIFGWEVAGLVGRGAMCESLF